MVRYKPDAAFRVGHETLQIPFRILPQTRWASRSRSLLILNFRDNWLRSSWNAFIMQSKSIFLEFLRSIHRYKFGHPKKYFRGEIIQGEWRNFHRARALFLTGVEFHVLPSLRLGVLQVCASLSRLTFSSRLVCFLWTVLPCLFIFTNTIAYAFWCQLRKQLYLIAFADLVPFAKEKVSLVRWNTVWNRWKSTLSARSIRVNLNHGKEM